MRYIKKNTEPQEFTEWKKQTPNLTYKKDLDCIDAAAIKQEVCKALINEQGYICCYCERELIKNDIKNDYHIDHLNPQSKKEGDDLDYSNMLCSCLGSTAKGDPIHCGRKKDDNTIPITPLQRDCQSKFNYTGYGEIDGVDEDAKKTIKILGLNIKKLIDLRKKALEFDDEDITNDKLKEFVNEYIKDTPCPFRSMIEYLYREYII